MKIKITRDSFCYARWDGDRWILDGCEENCDINDHLSKTLQSSGLPCLTTVIDEGEPFFFGVSVYSIGNVANTSHYIGQFETLDGILTLKVDKLIEGQNYYYSDDQTALVFSYQPTDLSLLSDHKCCILTSDALICLEEDSYIGYKDGHIDELSAPELLEQLSRHDAERSPHYKRVELSPLTRRPQRPRQGTFIFNKVSKKLEFFNGKSWQTVKTED